MDAPAYPLGELVAYARQRCPYYRRLYKNVPANPTLTDLPVLDQADFWAAHNADRDEVLTAPLDGGIVINSGGTTGSPKFAYLNREELDLAIVLTTFCTEGVGLTDGERIANLFGVGELYGSFIGLTLSLKDARANVLQFPIAYHASDASVARFMRQFQIDVLASAPTRLLRVIDYLEQQRITDLPIRRLLFAGEPFFPAQRAYADRHFPGVDIRSLGYASVDAGMMGVVDQSCGPGEHRVLDLSGIMEIFDENTGEPIDEVGRPGRVIYTNLARRLMPIIRYPAGDRAEWLEPAGVPQRKFMLLGRSEEAARVGFENVHVSDVRMILEPFAERLELVDFQFLLTQEQRLDRLTLRLGVRAAPEVCKELEPEILEAFHAVKPKLPMMVVAKAIHPTRIEWIQPSELLFNERTGKIRKVIDRRAG